MQNTLLPAIPTNLRRGIEKESLRVRPDGTLAATPHPRALGAALTHPHVTTDFSEAQLELITGVHSTVAGCLDELTRIHQFVYRCIGDERLRASMPCACRTRTRYPSRASGTRTGRQDAVPDGLSHR
jgi:glutamate--cysteine ligase